MIPLPLKQGLKLCISVNIDTFKQCYDSTSTKTRIETKFCLTEGLKMCSYDSTSTKTRIETIFASTSILLNPGYDSTSTKTRIETLREIQEYSDYLPL